MSANNQQILIDHLDKTLQGESLPEAEVLIRTDSQAQKDWEWLQLTVEAVQHHALHARVSAVREQMQQGRLLSVSRPAVRPVRAVLRVAAAAMLVIGTVIVYKFATVTPAGFYSGNYTSYELSTTRGSGETSAVEQAYRNKNWNEVISAYNALPLKTNRDHFLAGVAALELKEFTQAAEHFSAVLTSNSQTGDNYFQDEAEYYLAMSYLANDEKEKAISILKKIKADNGHLYHQKVNEMSATDLKVLELK